MSFYLPRKHHFLGRGRSLFHWHECIVFVHLGKPCRPVNHSFPTSLRPVEPLNFCVIGYSILGGILLEGRAAVAHQQSSGCLLHHLKENPQIRHTVFPVRREKISSNNCSTGDFTRHYDAIEKIRVVLHLEGFCWCDGSA